MIQCTVHVHVGIENNSTAAALTTSYLNTKTSYCELKNNKNACLVLLPRTMIKEIYNCTKENTKKNQWLWI